MVSLKEKYNKTIAPELKKKFGHKNILAAPRVVKVVVNVGLGSKKDDKEKMTNIEKSLTLITGQKPKQNPAKKAIASFKLRQGTIIGYSSTLRGKRMYDFLEKLINAALPRIRDFRGLKETSIDHSGNLNIGIKEHIVFPETADEDVRSAFGVGITIAANAKSKEEAKELFKLLGFKFSKK